MAATASLPGWDLAVHLLVCGTLSPLHHIEWPLPVYVSITLVVVTERHQLAPTCMLQNAPSAELFLPTPAAPPQLPQKLRALSARAIAIICTTHTSLQHTADSCMQARFIRSLFRASSLNKLICSRPLQHTQQPLLHTSSMQALADHSENVAPPTSTSGAAAAMEPPTKQARISPAAAPVDESFRVQRMSDKASLPKRGSAKAAGYDISR